MARTDDEKRAYAKGYAAGCNRRWPEHRPPAPPEPVIRRLMEVLGNLRDAADGICATLDEDDEFVAKLGPGVDEANAALAAVTEWLTRIEDGTIEPKG